MQMNPIKLLTVAVIFSMIAMSPDSWAEEASATSDPNHGAMGGPSSVGGTLHGDGKDRKNLISLEGLERQVQSYRDFKAALKKKHGWAYGFDYNALFQYASASPGHNSAAGGAARFYGQWAAVGRDTGHTGKLIYKVENRHRLGTAISPQSLGAEIGYAGLTAVPFSSMQWGVTNFFWEQSLDQNRWTLLAGIVDVTDYVGTYSLVSPWTTFSNLAFSTDPTIPAPNQGLGAAVNRMVTENIYVMGGLADGNGDPTRPDNAFDTFFNDAEYFSHLEIGWMASYAQRYSDNVHLSVWYADSRQAAQVPSGWGMAFSWNQLLKKVWEPFLRIGYADDGGAMWDRSVGLGVGYHTRSKSDLLGVGLNCGRPCASTYGQTLSEQYTGEVFYRMQLLPQLAVTPDLQLLVNPASNPNEDMIAVLGLRGRFSF